MSDPTDPPVPFTQFAEVLSLMPDLYAKLLTIHVADRATGKCVACTQPGTGVPAAAWPCAMRQLGSAAHDIRVKRCGGVQLRGRPG